MKVCRRGYEYLQVCDEYGTVSPCSWSNFVMIDKRDVGKLTENTMYEIMHGEKMKEWMDSLLDGSYRFCDAERCPYIANNTLEENSVEYRGELDYPLEFSISYDLSCNYTCTSCRSQNCTHSEERTERFEKIANEIRVFMNGLKRISANGRGELFASPTILGLLEEWKPTCENPSVDLETNGSLFNEKNWEKIKNLGQYNLSVYITVMSFNNQTYQQLSGVKYDISRIEDNLRLVKSLREKNIINYLELATVVQERNFRTLPDFSRRCLEEFGADAVRLRPYYPFGVYPAIIEWFFDVRNEKHPYHQEYVEVMKDPIFNNPKIYHWAGKGSEISREIPGLNERHTAQYDLTKEIFENEEFANDFSTYLLNKGINEIYIYAAGIMGKVFMCFLEGASVNLCGFIDEYTTNKEYRGIPIYHMTDNEVDKNKMVIVSLPNGEECIVEDLLSKGFKNVCSLKQLIKEIKISSLC